MPLDKKIAVSVSIIGTIVAEWLGGWDMAIKYLVLFMAMDYGTGVYRAYKDKVLSSAIGIDGVLKKVMILVVVAVAVVVDNITGAQGVVRSATIWFYLGMEGISILENAAKSGIPIPEKIKDALLQIKDGGKKSTVIVETTAIKEPVESEEDK
jgi:toxin secretion/phage lysis holin